MATRTKPRIRVGIAAGPTPHGAGVLSLNDLNAKRELEYASASLSTIEINGRSTALQKPESYEKW